MNTLESKSTQRIYSLQVLRGLSALFVMLFHMQYYIQSYTSNTVLQFVPRIFGYAASLFFVISGYVMANLIESNRRNFLFNRLLRIYPPYIVAICITLMLNVDIYKGISFTDFIKSITLLPFGKINYLLGIEWTLVFEIFFYLLCSIFANDFMKKFFKFFLIFWFIMISLGYYFNVSNVQFPPLNILIFQTYNYFFILGAFTFYARSKIKLLLPRLFHYTLLVTLVVIILVLFPIAINSSPFLLKYLNLIFSLLFAAFVYLFSYVNINSNNFFVKLGDYSYGLYLIHVQIILAGLSVWTKILHYPVNDLTCLFIFVIALSCGIYFGKLDLWLYKNLKKINMKEILLHNYKHALTLALVLLLIIFMQNFSVAFVTTPNLEVSVSVSDYKTKNEIKLPDTIKQCTDKPYTWIEGINADKVLTKNIKLPNNEYAKLFGWAVDPLANKVASKVIIQVGDKYFDTAYGQERTYIVHDLNNPEYLNSGFTATISTKEIKDAGGFKVHVISNDGTYVYEPIYYTLN